MNHYAYDNINNSMFIIQIKAKPRINLNKRHDGILINTTKLSETKEIGWIMNQLLRNQKLFTLTGGLPHLTFLH